MPFKHKIMIVLLMIAIYAKGQNKLIQGTVVNRQSNESLAFSNILVIENNGTITKTINRINSDEGGKFQFSVPQNLKNLTLIVSSLGFKSDTVLIKDSSTSYKIFLENLESNINEVVVTGVTRASLIRENPISIISISSKTIEQTNESNIIDVLVKNAPGLQAVKTGANISKPFIRGLGYNRVLTLYDGIRQEGQQWGDEHGIEVDAYNIERAEVIKGPSSLLYGSDALAGVVSFFPSMPNEKDKKIHGKIYSEFQTNNNLIGNGFRISYSRKHFLTSVRGSYRIAKNFRNSIDGRVYNTNFEEKNLSALFGYQSDKGYSHFNFTLYDNLQGIPDGSRDSLTRKFTKQIFEGDKDDIKNRPIIPIEELNTYQLSPLHQHIQHYRLYSHHFYKLGNGDLDILLGVQQNIRREYNHPEMPNQPGMYVRLNTLNYGLRYNLPKIKNIESSIGVNGMFQGNKSLNATNFPIPDYQLLDGGMYLFTKWKQNNWTISGGLRYDIRYVQWHNFYIGVNPKTGFDEHIISSDITNAILQFPAYNKTFSGTSASLGLTFQATKNVGLKFNIGRGYRAPSITEMASNGLDPGAHIIYLGNKNFNPEFSLQEDIGVNGRYENFSAELSLFNNNIQNYIYLSKLVDANGNQILDRQGNKTYQYQQGSAQLYGSEVWVSIHPKKLKGFIFENSLTTVYGFNRKTIYEGKGINGEFLPLIPPIKLMSSLLKKIEIKKGNFKTITPKIEFEYTATQNKFLALNNSESLTPSFLLFNIGINSEIKYFKTQTLQLQFQINNLFDKAYQSNLSRLKYFEYYSQSSNGKNGMYNMGRNISLKLIFPF